MKIIKRWKMSELKQLKANLHLTDAKLAPMFNTNELSVKNARKRYGFMKTKEGTQFKKGSKPRHAYQKGHTHGMATRFKKGGLPHNTKFDGAITIRTDKRGVQYKYIRIAKAVWKPLQVYNWEQINGPVPPKHILIFKDHDTMNCEPGNMELISRKAHMRRNSNQEKAAAAMKKVWASVRAFEDYGLTPVTKFRSKRKLA
jgi:hypothetical protein